MKIEKLSLKGINNVLSRTEMKNIMAGSGSGGTTTCCGHTADGQLSQCGISMYAAQQWPMWCCSSCIGPFNH